MFQRLRVVRPCDGSTSDAFERVFNLTFQSGIHVRFALYRSRCPLLLCIHCRHHHSSFVFFPRRLLFLLLVVVVVVLLLLLRLRLSLFPREDSLSLTVSLPSSSSSSSSSLPCFSFSFLDPRILRRRRLLPRRRANLLRDRGNFGTAFCVMFYRNDGF